MKIYILKVIAIKEARDGIKEYIDTYYKERLHYSLDYKL